ncbi:hypothetical protein F2Q68_00040561 [Brassica cretica]|uniref:Pectin acetylesterase n=1 Tax=Brassica cretica TaxID=69181 RepID=A0A8S9MJA5_BRACR|nr:hypothetical protein F2Q68_00040561 [Brassica cretica]
MFLPDWRTVLSSAFRASSSPRTCLLGGGFRCFTAKTSPDEEEQKKKEITLAEAKKLMRLVNLEDMKKKLVDLPDEAHVFARVLDDAGVVLIFRDKVVDLIRRVFPTDETAEEAQIKDEFNKMRTMKEEIDVLAHRQVRKILWCGLATAIVQISLFVRLTFWEFSWDVMEPITFFATATTILRCDDFSSLFPPNTKVKCMSDAGFFLDAVDISGAHSIRRMYSGVVNTQGLQNTLPRTCTSHLDPTLCFFPQNIINQVKTPLFILNSAFDSWQIENSIAPPSADPSGSWHNCSSSFKCNTSQMQFLEAIYTLVANQN